MQPNNNPKISHLFTVLHALHSTLTKQNLLANILARFVEKLVK